MACNEQGRSLCEGVVEFERKNAAQQALQRINNGAFLLTPGPRPLIVEQLEHKLVSSDLVPLMTKIFINPDISILRRLVCSALKE